MRAVLEDAVQCLAGEIGPRQGVRSWLSRRASGSDRRCALAVLFPERLRRSGFDVDRMRNRCCAMRQIAGGERDDCRGASAAGSGAPDRTDDPRR
jgi:hypothetical protein